MTIDLGSLPAPEQPAAPQLGPNDAPVKIHMISQRTFIVDKVGGWGYLEAGVFATGHWKGYTGIHDTHVIIPYDRVDWYELDIDKLERFIMEHQPPEEADADPSA